MAKRKEMVGKATIIMYDTSVVARNMVCEKLLAWYKDHGKYNGEAIMQDDDCVTEAPELLAMIADDIFEFEVGGK